jgi:hypothetical protein
LWWRFFGLYLAFGDSMHVATPLGRRLHVVAKLLHIALLGYLPERALAGQYLELGSMGFPGV